MKYTFKPHHYVLALVSGLATILAAGSFAYLAGIGVWLEGLPTSFWIVTTLLGFALGLVLGSGSIIVMQHRLSAMLRRLIWLVEKLYTGIEVKRSQDEQRRVKHMAYALKLITDTPLYDGTCKVCGSTHRELSANPYDGKYHNEKCPVPYARLLSQDGIKETSNFTESESATVQS